LLYLTHQLMILLILSGWIFVSIFVCRVETRQRLNADAAGSGASLHLVSYIWRPTFGVSTFGVSTFGISTFGISTLGVNLGGKPEVPIYQQCPVPQVRVHLMIPMVSSGLPPRSIPN
ncbi:MAG: hypothetical protein AAFX80_24165, partial [Cyanobacteria bacterium J06639_18]